MQQRCERLLEMFAEVARATVRVDVVTCKNHEIKGRLLMSLKHLFGDAELIAVPSPWITNYREA
jgi:hypothetical protein